MGALGGKDDKVMRECTRLHHDLVPFVELSDIDQFKDSAPMLKMLELIHEFEGLSIYRMYGLAQERNPSPTVRRA